MGWTRLLMILVALLLRVLVGLYGYSGAGKPPMYGDYEAQRHWMEITYNLPANEWYQNTTNNDLLYWGLDYPPLTAYHSWLLGVASAAVNPAYVALNSSRGYESPDHKYFMRSTALVSDVVAYFVPVLLLGADDLTTFGLLTYPGLMLIDHGHFQYNCVSLGLVVAAIAALGKNWLVVAAVLFSLALNFKQMTLYYALPFFAFMLNKSLTRHSWSAAFGQLFRLGISVVFTFALLWMPFASDPVQVVRRLFPVDRGVFEDKVSNFWCVVNVFYKIKRRFTNEEMAIVCGLATLVSALPSCGHLLFRATATNFIHCLLNTALSFFLFSFQVHEKSILLVALPAALLLRDRPFHAAWLLHVSTFSMLPLLLKDDLLLPFVATSVLFASSLSIIFDVVAAHRCRILRFAYVASLLSMSLLTILSTVAKPPPRYPDLFPLLISASSAAHFAYFSLYFHWSQFTSSKTKTS